MLRLPKGLKKKKKGKKSKRKGEEELFTEEELEKYRREHQHSNTGEGDVKENEEWSKFKDLTTGIDSFLKKTQGDLDRIKSTSFFQRVPAGPKQVERSPEETQRRPIVEVTAADFPRLAQASAAEEEGEKSDYGVTDDESEEEDQDDIFDTSYVEAVERGEVKLAYVPDSPEQCLDDDIFDTSHVDVLIKGQESKSSKGKKTLDIGVAVEVLTGRIDNVTVTTKRPKRVIPGDLLLEDTSQNSSVTTFTTVKEPPEKSILDTDADIPITAPIDLSVSLHTSLIQQHNKNDLDYNNEKIDIKKSESEHDFDEFTLLATESLEISAEVTRLDKKDIQLQPVVLDSWSVFEADKNEFYFADCIVEDQIDFVDPYEGLDDPFDTSFADAVVPTTKSTIREEGILENDDEFDPRAEEIQPRLNNRRKSSVRIHLTNPLGVRESITSDDPQADKEEAQISRDLLGGSTTDLTKLEHSPLNPIDVNNSEFDPFDTTVVDQIVAPGKVELKFLEQELIGTVTSSVFRVPSDPDFDPRADEPKITERRASRPENLTVNKTVVFDVKAQESSDLEVKQKIAKPLTPYYTRELSITENISEESEEIDTVPESLVKTRSDEDLSSKINYPAKRRHSEYTQPIHIKVDFRTNDFLHSGQSNIAVKVLTPLISESVEKVIQSENDPFDTSYASVVPSKTELKLLTKEFSCEETSISEQKSTYDLLEPSDDIFQVKTLSPEPSDDGKLTEEGFDPFDTSFAVNLNPGKTELKLLESELLN